MKENKLVIEGAKLLFRNFGGKAGTYNPEGRRNFCVLLDVETAEKLEAEGWNIKWAKPRDDQDEQQPYLQVAVNFANLPPKIVMMTSKGKTVLNEESVNTLDFADIEEVDLIVNPSKWIQYKGTKDERERVKAYLKSMYVTLFEDELEKKYYDVPDSAIGSVGGCGNCEECDGTCHGH